MRERERETKYNLKKCLKIVCWDFCWLLKKNNRRNRRAYRNRAKKKTHVLFLVTSIHNINMADQIEENLFHNVNVHTT